MDPTDRDSTEDCVFKTCPGHKKQEKKEEPVWGGEGDRVSECRGLSEIERTRMSLLRL